VLYTVTMKNTIYAFDADDPAASVELWKASLGPAVPKAMLCGCNDIQPEVGATATPSSTWPARRSTSRPNNS